jgi:hypothetical protein
MILFLRVRFTSESKVQNSSEVDEVFTRQGGGRFFASLIVYWSWDGHLRVQAA